MGATRVLGVALFAEMYVIRWPVYLLGVGLGSRYPLLPGTHAGGHLWNDLIGWIGDPCLSPVPPGKLRGNRDRTLAAPWACSW